jgi:predicted ester cyclase
MKWRAKKKFHPDRISFLENYPSEAKMSAEENINVVREMIAALDRSDWAAIEKHPGMGQTRKVHPMIHTIFPDYHHAIEQVIIDGDMVAVRLIASGTHQAPFMGVAPTGKLITIGVLMMMRVKDGKIIEYWANADMASTLEQLGLLKLPR